MKRHDLRIRNTHRPLSERLRLVADPHLGAGNFFWRSYRHLAAKDRPVFFADAGRRYTYRDLAGHILDLMEFYRGQGVRTGTHVGLQSGDGVTGFAHHVAVTSLGAVAVHCNPLMDPARARDYFATAGTRMVFADKPQTGWRALRPLDDVSPVVTSMPDPRFAADHLIMISHSSGTTGVPKAPMFTHRGFFIGKRQRLLTFAQTREDRLFTSLPHSHSAGLSYMTTALLTGTPLYVHNRSSAVTVEKAISAFAPTGILSFPSTLGDLDPGLIDEASLDAVRFWNGMGDASHAAHIRRLLNATPQAVYVDGLGSSEMGMVLFQQTKRRGCRATRVVGRPVAVVRDVATFDASGARHTGSAAGRLAVRTPSATPGYYGDPELTASSQQDGYFFTGDIAEEIEPGVWRHLDRVSDVIRTPDGDVYSTLMEELVHDAVDATDSAVVALATTAGEYRPAVFVVLRSPSGLSAADVHDKICRRLDDAQERHTSAPAAVVVLSGVEGMPRGVTGKVLKRTLRDDYASLLTDRDLQVGSVVADVHYA